MDPVDYLRLDEFIRRYHCPDTTADGRPAQHFRTPLMLTHAVPVLPGWAAVLVVWDATQHGLTEQDIKVATFGYCPQSETRYALRGAWSSGHYNAKHLLKDANPYDPHGPDFTPDFDGEVHSFTNPDIALKFAADTLR